MKKFWNWVTNETGGDELRIDGYITADDFWGFLYECTTPSEFKQELDAHKGDITVWINSTGGETIAASRIYTMLREYKGKVTVKIDGIAASAASVIAMSGKEVLMSPTSMLMIHNPLVGITGEVADLEQAIHMLNECKESIVTAYQLKSGLSRAKISRLMDAETWMNARAAVEYGFADGMLYGDIDETEPVITDRMTTIAATAGALRKMYTRTTPPSPQQQPGTSISSLDKRLSLIVH